LIFGKIITIVATRGQIVTLKCIKLYSARALPRWGSLDRSSVTLAGFKGPTSKRRERRRGKEKGGDPGRGRKGKKRERRGWKRKGREGTRFGPKNSGAETPTGVRRSYLVTLFIHGAGGVAGTLFTAETAGQLPMVPLTLVTSKSKHVRQTDALTGDRVAGTSRAICAEDIAHARYKHYSNEMHRRRRRGIRGYTCPLKFGKKYFWGNYYVKFGNFSGKNRAKFGNFVNFSGKYYKNSDILLIFSGKNYVKFGHFVIFSYIFFGQKCRAPQS